MSESLFSIREATPSDTLKIIDFTFKSKNALHFPPAQLEWMLKQENSPFFTFLYFERGDSSDLKGILIGKKKGIQLEILELYFLNDTTLITPLLEHLIHYGRTHLVEGLFGLFPKHNKLLEKALVDTKFKLTKTIPHYYTNNEDAELWSQTLI